MKVILAMMLLVQQLVYSQTHGTGGGSIADNEIAVCRPAAIIAKRIVNRYNSYQKNPKDKVKDIHGFIAELNNMVYTIKFHELQKIVNQDNIKNEINKKCGKKTSENLIKKYPWIADKALLHDLGKFRIQELQNRCYKIKPEKFDLPIKFLEYWNKTKAPKENNYEQYKMMQQMGNGFSA
jgi:hypothetical protein